jgi:LSD1 subclass zinc finger protein
MGGPTSGNWFPRCKKDTVEDALALDVRNLRPAIRAHVADTFSVTWGMNHRNASIGLSIEWDAAGPWDAAVPIVTLDYSYNDEEVCIRVRLESTPTNFYGERWWFTCPLIVDGVTCERRVGKLYLPPGARYFRCRVCHDLTYRSCQTGRPRRFRPHAA